MTAPEPRAACAGLPDIFESTTLFDHRIAVRYCLGNNDRPACPMLAACQQLETEQDWHEGTWAGVLYRKGREIARHGQMRKAKKAAA